MPTEDPALKRRPRLSLLSLLLLTTTVGMGLATWRTYQKLTPLEQRIGRLRAELGVVQVSDPELVCFTSQSVRGFDNFRNFVWRAYVPEQARANVTLKLIESGPGWSGSDVSFVVLPPGESTFELIVWREATSDRWKYSVSDGRGRGPRTDGPLPPWYKEDGSQRAFTSSSGSPGLAPGKSHEILREKATRSDGSSVEVVLTIFRDP